MKYFNATDCGKEGIVTSYNVEFAIRSLRAEPKNAHIPEEFWNQLATHLSDKRHYWLHDILDDNFEPPYDEVYFKALAVVEDWHKQHPGS